MSSKKVSSQDLGINLEKSLPARRRENELFKWFLACLLFGKPIQQEVAKRAYFEFVKAGLVAPDKILRAGWNKLVKVLDKGHYVRYDFSTATKILYVCKELKARYGSVSNLIKQSESKSDLSRRLQEFKGVGSVTTRIFLRDLYNGR